MSKRMMGFEAHGASKQLVVLLHALTLDTFSLASVGVAAQGRLPDADTWMPKLPITWIVTRSRGAEMASRLLEGIDALVAAREARGDGRQYEEILFVGHSYGAALARAVWAEAMGGRPDGAADLSLARPWAARVRRIVLLAAVARGWNQLSPVSTSVRLANWGADIVEVLCGDGFAVFDVRRGAPWITSTRLQTISVTEALRKNGDALPLTIQLLGTVDDVVAPSDNVDLATGGNFYYVEVPRTNHLNVVDFNGAVGIRRRELFLIALAGSPAELAQVALKPRELADMVDDALDDHDRDYEDPKPGTPDELPGPLRVNRDVQTIVFVVHGIRDYGYWTRKLASRIKERARSATPPIRCRTVTSSYGFFPMGRS